MVASSFVVDRLADSLNAWRGVRYLACIAVLAAPLSAAAQTVWTFEVREVVETSATEHLLRLAPAPPGVEYPRTCDEFVVRVKLNRGQGVPEHLYRYFDIVGYERAIRRIREAKHRDELLRLGSLDRGFGFGPDSSNECEVSSAGLGILPAASSRDTIFSVY